MKRRNSRQLFACCLLFYFSGCSPYIEEKENVPQLPDTGNALRILSARMENASDEASGNPSDRVSGTPSTSRSITTSVQTDGNQLGIFAVNSDLSAYAPSDGINPATYTYQSGSWTVSDPADQLRIPKTNNLSVYAWHPVADGLTPVYQSGGGSYLSGINILSRDDFAATGQTDYLYPAAPATVSLSSRSATFTLKHALAKLTLKVYKSSSLTDEMVLTGLQINDYSTMLQTGTDKIMSLKDGSLQGLNGASNFTMTATDSQKAKILHKDDTSGSTTASPFCLLAPAPGVEYLSFQLTTLTGGQEQLFLTQRTDFSAHRWKSGEHLVITILLEGMKATITGMQVYDWGDYSDTYLPVS